MKEGGRKRRRGLRKICMEGEERYGTGQGKGMLVEFTKRKIRRVREERKTFEGRKS